MGRTSLHASLPQLTQSPERLFSASIAWPAGWPKLAPSSRSLSYLLLSSQTSPHLVMNFTKITHHIINRKDGYCRFRILEFGESFYCSQRQPWGYSKV